MNAKEILAKVKALFEAPIVTPVVPDAAAMPSPAAIVTGTIYKLKDGSEISITMAGPEPAVGDLVTIASVPAPAGDYNLEDGSVITVDATGAITVIVAAIPVTQPDFVAPPVLTLEDRIKAIENRLNPPPIIPAGMAATTPADVPDTPEGIRALYLKFAVGTAEERLANLELVAKACMEYCFGWQLREAEAKATADQAINVYKQGLVTAQAGMAKQDEVIKGLFELVENLVNEPMAEPITLNGARKEKFEKRAKKDGQLERIADTMKQIKTLN